MITRIFRVDVFPELREEFEVKFATVSVEAVESHAGFLEVTVGKPSHWSPNEYVMISRWETEEALEAFAGEKWNQAFIPEGMEKYVQNCSVHHYHSW